MGREETDGAFWVFAYGSLMWKPGFMAAETRRAVIHGYHRDMCLISYHYRGTKRTPGMVLGLDLGGSCHGVAMRAPKSKADAVYRYLHKREMLDGVYIERNIMARLDDGRRVRALAYVVNREHRQYAGRLAITTKTKMIRTGTGIHGTARDYLANTVAHLEEMELSDHALHRLLALVDRRATIRR